MELSRIEYVGKLWSGDPTSFKVKGCLCLCCIMFLLQFINISHLAVILVLSHLQPHMDSLLCQHIYFSLFMSISFEIVYTCVYIENTKDHEVLIWQPQIIYIYVLFCSFTAMIPLVFHICQSHLFSANAYEAFTAIHKYFTLKFYTCIYIGQILMCMKLSQSQLFYICKPYLFCNIYGPFSIPC